MFALLRLIFRIAFLMFIVFLVLAFFSNPTTEDFSKKLEEELNEEVSEQTNNPALQYIAELGKEFTKQVGEKLVERKNYLVCSVFTVHMPDGDYRFLGAFNQFIPLQEKNPLDQFSLEHQ